MENNIVKVCGYIRVSTEGQVKKGYSLSEQQAEIERHCREMGFQLVAVYRDEGISGAKANEDEMSIERDGLLDMLASLKKSNIYSKFREKCHTPNTEPISSHLPS